LKEKRAVIKPILEGARRRYQVAAGEIAFQDKWQRALVGFSCVGPDGDGHAAAVIQRVEEFVSSFPEVEVLRAERAAFAWND
jgi:hypothetical protein